MTTSEENLWHTLPERGQTSEESEQEVEAWLSRALAAETTADKLTYLSRAIALNPRHAVARRLLHEALKIRLDQDAFLRYRQENDALYLIQTGDRVLVIVPKGRAIPPPYPSREPTPLDPALHWLRWAIFGLLPAGFGALVFAVLALGAAIRVRKQLLNTADRVRSRVVILAALLLFFVGLTLVSLFLLHF